MGGLEQFRGDTLAADEPEPAEYALALATIERHARDAADLELLTGVVFGKAGPVRRHGDKPSQRWAQARREWLDRCRAWLAGQGRPRSTSWIPPEEQRAYVEATGDAWVAPGPERAVA